MPRGIVVSLAAVAGLGWLLLSAPTIRAADTEDVKFETYDRVEIKGIFYPGKKSEPCVLILPKYGTSYKDDDWDKLALALQKTGCAVLMFDYRGHGDSTTIKKPEKFWEDHENRAGVRGYDPRKLKSELATKDFTREYLPHLVNDLEAARLFLDRKNDAGQCNSRAIVTISAEDGGVLGAMWAYSEMYRFREKKGGKLPDPEGSDLLGSVWLTPTSKLGTKETEQNTQALAWLTDVGAPAPAHNLPMAFFYGGNDTAGKNFANSAFKAVRPQKDNKVTLEHVIKDTNLKGSKLLDNQLSTQDDIVTYIDGLKKAKSVAEWDSKDTKKNQYWWILKGTTTALPAKDADEDYFDRVPMIMLR